MKHTSTISLLVLAAVALVIAASDARAQFPRTVLVEEFTSLTCKPCTTATPILNKLIRDKAGKVVTIRYHANIPLPGDPYYNANKDQNNARKTFYGVSALPFGVADGSTSLSVTQEGDVVDKVDARLEMSAPLKMEVTQTREGNQCSVMVKLTAGPDGLSGTDYKLRVVAVESFIHDAQWVGDPRYNGESEFFDVMRQMVPDPAGTDIALEPEQVKTQTFVYTVPQDWQADQMYAVAFVQNDANNEVVQTGYSPRPVAGVSEASALNAGYTLATAVPNPARDRATIQFTMGTAGDAAIELYDAAGANARTVRLGHREAGPATAVVDLGGLPAGAYTCVLRAGGYSLSRSLHIVR